jgi:hypothetical protein
VSGARFRTGQRATGPPPRRCVSTLSVLATLPLTPSRSVREAACGSRLRQRRAAQPQESAMGDADLSESCVAGGRRSVSTVQPAPRYLRPNWPMVWPAPQRARSESWCRSPTAKALSSPPDRSAHPQRAPNRQGASRGPAGAGARPAARSGIEASGEALACPMPMCVPSTVSPAPPTCLPPRTAGSQGNGERATLVE